jgi:hypothetical protein
LTREPATLAALDLVRVPAALRELAATWENAIEPPDDRRLDNCDLVIAQTTRTFSA